MKFISWVPWCWYSYVRKHLDGSGPNSEDTEAIKAELDFSKAKIEELEQENAALKDKLLQCEGPRGENPQREDAQAADSVAPDTEEEEGGLAVTPGPSEWTPNGPNGKVWLQISHCGKALPMKNGLI